MILEITLGAAIASFDAVSIGALTINQELFRCSERLTYTCQAKCLETLGQPPSRF